MFPAVSVNSSAPMNRSANTRPSKLAFGGRRLSRALDLILPGRGNTQDTGDTVAITSPKATGDPQGSGDTTANISPTGASNTQETGNTVEATASSPKSFPFPDLTLQTGSTCTKEELNECGALIEEVLSKEFPGGMFNGASEQAHMEPYVNKSGSHVILIRDKQGELVGTGCFGPYTSGSKEKAYIPTVYLSQKYRKQGIGEWMVQELIDKAREMGYQKITLQTSKEIASKLYTKVGFTTKSPNASSRSYELDLTDPVQ